MYWYKCTVSQCGRHVTMTEDNSEKNLKGMKRVTQYMRWLEKKIEPSDLSLPSLERQPFLTLDEVRTISIICPFLKVMHGITGSPVWRRRQCCTFLSLIQQIMNHLPHQLSESEVPMLGWAQRDNFQTMPLEQIGEDRHSPVFRSKYVSMETTFLGMLYLNHPPAQCIIKMY